MLVLSLLASESVFVLRSSATYGFVDATAEILWTTTQRMEMVLSSKISAITHVQGISRLTVVEVPLLTFTTIRLSPFRLLLPSNHQSADTTQKAAIRT